MKKIFLISFIVSIAFQNAYCQDNKDTLNAKRLVASMAFNVTALSSSYIALNQLWYKDYSQTSLHWFNDGSEWLQVDKLGHAFSSYHVSSIYASQLKWCGLNAKKSAILGAGLGFVNISMIELLDAKSEAWGASPYDLLANSLGSVLFIGQRLLWKEERVKFKFSFHTTEYPKYRSDILGRSFSEQIMKDYNGQTYWLSANVKSLLNMDTFPGWLNIAVGYGATGMVVGDQSALHPKDITFGRERQFLLSFDLDLSRIPVKRRWLKKMFSVINIIKFPAPAIEIRSGNLYGHYLYF